MPMTHFRPCERRCADAGRRLRLDDRAGAISTKCKKSPPPVIGLRAAMTGWTGSVRPLPLRLAVRLESFDRGEQTSGVGRVAKEEVGLVLRL
jgi:hypothetical protein